MFKQIGGFRGSTLLIDRTSGKVVGTATGTRVS